MTSGRTRANWALATTLFLPVAATAGPITVSGTVTTAAGAPLAGAEVELVATLSPVEALRIALDESAATPTVRAVTGTAGRFDLVAPAAGMWRLRVSAPGRAPLLWQFEPLIEDELLPPAVLQDGAMIAVRVIGPEGQPVGGARVAARPQYGPSGWQPARQVVATDASGECRFLVPPAEPFGVFAGAPGWIGASASANGPQELILTLKKGATRTLEVVDAAGRLQRGVAITTEGMSAITGDDGRAAVHVPEGAAQVRAEIYTVEGRHQSIALAPGEEAWRVVLQPLEPLTGRVVDADSGEALRGAWVWDLACPACAVRTGTDGAFSLPGATRTTDGRELRFVRAAAVGHIPAATDPTEIPKAGTVLKLWPAVVLAGTVADGTGSPVVGVEVVAGHRQPPFAKLEWRGGVAAGADGRWRLRIADNRRERPWTVRALHPEYSPAERELAAGDDRARVRLVLRRGGGLAGRFVGPSGESVAGVRVRLHPAMADMKSRPGAYPEESDHETVSGDDGRFGFSLLPPQRFDLLASADGFAPFVLPGVAAPEDGAVVELGDVALPPAATIAGRVVDPEGVAVEGARVAVASKPFQRPRPQLAGEIVAISDPEGEFLLTGLPIGVAVDLVVHHSDFSPGSAPAVVPPPEQPLVVSLHPPGKIFGSVRDGDDRPIAGARLTARSFQLQPQPDRTDVTDDQGDFLLQVGAGRWRLRVEAEGFAAGEEEPVEVAEGETAGPFDLRLATVASLSGRVVDESGRPVGGAYVSLRHEREANRSHGAETDAGGRFELPYLAAGTVRLVALHPEAGRGERELELRAGANDADLRLTLAGVVSGRVLDPEGRPVAGARIELDGERGTSTTGSAPDGAFLFGTVEPGSYRLAAQASGFHRTEAEPLSVGPEGVRGLELRLRRGNRAAIRGRLLGLAQEALGEVSMVAKTPSGQSLDVAVDHRGGYRIADAEPGEWTIRAHTRKTSAQGTVLVTEGPGEAVLDLELLPGYRLSGTVALNGRPWAGAPAALHGPGPDRREVTADAEGRFEVAGLAEGRYWLSFSLPDGQQISGRSLEVAGDVEIRLALTAHQVAGRAVWAGSGLPASGVRIALLPLDSETSSVQSIPVDEDGTFRLRGVADGAYRLMAGIENESFGEIPLTVAGENLAGLVVEVVPGAAFVF